MWFGLVAETGLEPAITHLERVVAYIRLLRPKNYCIQLRLETANSPCSIYFLNWKNRRFGYSPPLLNIFLVFKCDHITHFYLCGVFYTTCGNYLRSILIFYGESELLKHYMKLSGFGTPTRNRTGIPSLGGLCIIRYTYGSLRLRLSGCQSGRGKRATPQS